MPDRRTTICLALLLSALAVNASAHRINLFVTVEAGTAKGSVYYSGGDGAQGMPVQILGPAGELLLTVTTDERGEFEFKPEVRCEHTVVCETEDGHRAEYVLSIDELPQTLPPCGSGTTANIENTVPDAAMPAVPATTPAGPEIEAAIEKIVARHTGELRKELARYEAQIRFQSVIGGLGFIAGIMGLVFYFKARARLKDTDDA